MPSVGKGANDTHHGPQWLGDLCGEAGAMGSLPDMRGPSTEPACRGHYTWAPAEQCLLGQASHTCGKQAGGETGGNGGACGNGQRIHTLKRNAMYFFLLFKNTVQPIKQNKTSKKLPLIKHTPQKKPHVMLCSEGFPSFLKTHFSNPRRCSAEW